MRGRTECAELYALYSCYPGQLPNVDEVALENKIRGAQQCALTTTEVELKGSAYSVPPDLTDSTAL